MLALLAGIAFAACSDPLPPPPVHASFGASERALAPLAGLVRNDGQFDREIALRATAPGGAFAVTRDGFALQACSDVAAACVRFRLDGASGDAVVETGDALPGLRHFFAGSDPARWRSRVPAFARATVHARRGVDLAFHASPAGVEYDLVLAPGVDPASVRLRVEGADSLRVDEAGNLAVAAGPFAFTNTPPRAFATSSDGTRREVPCRYRIERDFEAGFEVEAASDAILCIDPSVVFATFLGGSADDYGGDLACDALGNLYVMGQTVSTDFPVTPGVFQQAKAGLPAEKDGYVARLDPTGSTLAYATYFGGSGFEEPHAIAIDALAQAHVGGRTHSSDFPVTPGAVQTALADASFFHGDGFVLKLAADGGSLAWSTYLGGGGVDYVAGIALDPAGRATALVSAGSETYPTTPGAYDETHNGWHTEADCAISQIRIDGSALVFSTFVGGFESEFLYPGRQIAVDSTGVVHFTGRTQSTDFPATPGAFDPVPPPSGVKNFLTRLAADGTHLVSSTFHTYCDPAGLAVTDSGATVISANMAPFSFPMTPLAFESDPPSSSPIAFRFSASGATLDWSTYIGATYFVSSIGAPALDAEGRVHLAGSTSDFAMLVSPDAVDPTHGGGEKWDGWICVLSPGGSCLAHCSYFGGNGNEFAGGAALDPLERTTFLGSTSLPSGTNLLPATPGAFDSTANGASDAFVAQYDLRCSGAFEAYGQPCPGPGGAAPQLRALGCPTASGRVRIEIRHGGAFARGVLLAGFGQGVVPFSPSCSLNIGPLAPSPVLLDFKLDPDGKFGFEVNLPPSLPSGSIFLQALLDADATPGGPVVTTPALRMDA